MLHLCCRIPLEGIPHLCWSAWFDIRSPDALRPINMPGQTSGEKIAVHSRAYILVVLQRPARGAVFIVDVARIVISRVIRLPVQCRLRMRVAEDLSHVPVVFVLPLVAHLVQGDPGVLAPASGFCFLLALVLIGVLY